MDGNCFFLRPNGSISLGMPAPDDDGLHVSVPGGPSLFLPFLRNTNTGKSPECSRGRLINAKVIAKGSGARIVLGRGQLSEAFLYIRTRDLRFGAACCTEFQVSNAWPGAETLRPAIVQCGSRNNRDQIQIVRIVDQWENPCPLIVADHGARYMEIRYREGVLQTNPATSQTLARHLVRRAELMRSATHQSLLWTFHALESLGCRDLWSRELGARMASLEVQHKE